jgi:transcriptional regulator GlxA family with amidase domain
MELWFLQAFGAPAGRVTLDPRLNKVLAWLYTEPPASFNLQAAARRAGISASHLRNLFQRYFGISPKTMVQGVRFTEARRLLESSELTVAEIAYRTGWKDATAFTKSFRKRFGLPPFEFRQARRGHLL